MTSETLLISVITIESVETGAITLLARKINRPIPAKKILGDDIYGVIKATLINTENEEQSSYHRLLRKVGGTKLYASFEAISESEVELIGQRGGGWLNNGFQEFDVLLP